MNKNEILKIYGTDFTRMTKCLLEEGNVKELIHGRHTLIGIKPNLVSPNPADYGGTTHPEITAGIIEYLQDAGFDNIIMLEGAWVGDRTSECCEVCGYRALSEKYGVPFFDTQKDEALTVDCTGMKLEICKKALEVEFLINVPVLKGHCQTRMTCALKNMKGLIPNREKRHFHSMGLHRPIAHLNTGLRQDLIVVDNICGDLDFEDGGNPVVRNCIMLSRDPVLTDAYACRLLHMSAGDVDYVVMAEKLGVGSADLGSADIRIIRRSVDSTEEPVRKDNCPENGNGTGPAKTDGVCTDEAVCSDTDLPVPGRVISLHDAVWEVDSCSACYGYLLPALQKLKDEGLFEKLDEKICIGQGYRGKKGKLGVGNCTRGFDTCIKGCPPSESEIYEGLKKYINSSRQNGI